MLANVIPGRDCDGCNVCCVALTINDPALYKVQGRTCPNALPDRRCAIYADRPDTCREFNCGWRLLPWVKLALRPDRSDVLIRPHVERDGSMGIAVHLLRREALRAEGLAETVAAAVADGRPVHLVIPGPPGYTAAHARIDHLLTHAVVTRDKPAVLAALRAAYKQGRAGKTMPIRPPSPVPAP